MTAHSSSAITGACLMHFTGQLMSVDAKCNNVWQTQGLLCGQTLDVGQCTHSTRGNNGGGGGGGRRVGDKETRKGEYQGG